MFTVQVPEGAKWQGHGAIFQPKPLLPIDAKTKPRPDDGFYFIRVHADCVLGKYPDFDVEPRDGQWFDMKSKVRPVVVLSNGDLGANPLPIQESSSKLAAMFHDLHWSGFTPDRVIRHIPKRIAFTTFESNHQFLGKKTILMLQGVMLNEDDILSSIEKLQSEVSEIY